MISLTKLYHYSYYDHVEKRKILTLPEEQELSNFILQSAKRGDGQKRNAIRTKIVSVHLLRRVTNMAGGSKCVALSSSAKAVLKSGTIDIKRFQEFYKEHNELKEVNPRDEDHARHQAACEATVNEHFEGQIGLLKPAKNPTAFQPMSPPESLGYGKGSLEYYKYKFEDCVDRVIPNFQMTPTLPSDVAILKPTSALKKTESEAKRQAEETQVYHKYKRR